MAGISIKRIYEKPSDNDGHRVLVDRIWPRGVSKKEAKLDEWNKEIAPSNELRKWFGHKGKRFAEFKKRYKKELTEHHGDLEQIAKIANKKTVTLLYGAKNEKMNQAVVLKEFLESTFQN